MIFPIQPQENTIHCRAQKCHNFLPPSYLDRERLQLPKPGLSPVGPSVHCLCSFRSCSVVFNKKNEVTFWIFVFN